MPSTISRESFRGRPVPAGSPNTSAICSKRRHSNDPAPSPRPPWSIRYEPAQHSRCFTPLKEAVLRRSPVTVLRQLGARGFVVFPQMLDRRTNLRLALTLSTHRPRPREDHRLYRSLRQPRHDPSHGSKTNERVNPFLRKLVDASEASINCGDAPAFSI